MAHNTTTPSPRCAARAPWAVGRISTGRIARGMRATGPERSDQDLSKAVLPTCHGFGAVEPQPAAWGRACSALAHNTTTPSPRCAACAPWAGCQIFAGRNARRTRATGSERGDQDLSKAVLPTCHGFGAVEPWPTARGRTCSALTDNTTTPSPRCPARAPWAGCQISTGRIARGTRATGSELGD